MTVLVVGYDLPTNNWDRTNPSLLIWSATSTPKTTPTGLFVENTGNIVFMGFSDNDASMHTNNRIVAADVSVHLVMMIQPKTGSAVMHQVQARVTPAATRNNQGNYANTLTNSGNPGTTTFGGLAAAANAGTITGTPLLDVSYTRGQFYLGSNYLGSDPKLYVGSTRATAAYRGEVRLF